MPDDLDEKQQPTATSEVSETSALGTDKTDPQKQLEEMLRTLLSKPGVKEKANSLLGIVSASSPGSKKETLTHSVKNYISVEVTTECLTCNHKDVRTVLFSKKETMTFIDNKGNTHVINFRNVDVPTNVKTHTATCVCCRDFIKTLSREKLEDMFMSLSQVSSLVWSAYQKQSREILEKPPEPLNPIKFPPFEKHKDLFKLTEEEFKAWLDEPEEDDYGENFTEVRGLPTDCSHSSISDADDVSDGEDVSEACNEGGDSPEQPDSDESPFPWASYLGSKRDAFDSRDNEELEEELILEQEKEKEDD